MSIQSHIRWILVFVISFLGTSKILSVQQLTRLQPEVSQLFYELLTEINEDSSASQLAIEPIGLRGFAAHVSLQRRQS